MLTNGNQKLGTDVWNFNLPRFTCKQFRNKLCDYYCYAKRNNFLNPWVIESMQRNYKESMNIYFGNKMISYIRMNKIKYIRLHSSGDFYSNDYFRQWCEIAEGVPDTKILAYTRNNNIIFRYAPDNFKLYFSTHFKYEYKSIEIENNMIAHKLAYLTNLDRIPQHMEKHFTGARYCSSKCYKCKHCFNSKKGNIVFVINMTDKGHTFREYENQMKIYDKE